MTGRRVLDDRRIDVVAAAYDQILGTAGDADEALGADGTEVAGDEPSVCREGGGRVAEIAREDVRPADHEHAAFARRDAFADLAVREHATRADVDTGGSRAHGSGDWSVLCAGGGDQAGALGHAIGLMYAHPNVFGELVAQRGRQ